jgi:hypothetical protein
VELPEAVLCHQSAQRLRFRVPAQRGDTAYFARVVKGLSGLRRFALLTANPTTGSVLCAGDDLDPSAIAAQASRLGLFRLREDSEPAPALMHRIVRPVAGIDRSLAVMTGGKIDLATAAFLALLASGVVQLLRGRLSVPPWYTAFWYAFGLATMVVVDRAARRAGDAPVAD